MESADGQLEIETIQTPEALKALSSSWQELLAGDVTGKTLFNDPRYIELQLESNPEFKPLVFVLRRQGQIRCIAPFYSSPGRLLVQSSVVKIASFPLRWAKLFGEDFLIGAGEDAAAMYAAVFAELANRRAEYDIISLDRIETASNLWNHASIHFIGDSDLKFFVASPQMEVAHQIAFPASHSDYMASLGSRTRQNLRRMTRKLVDEKQASLSRITAPEGVHDFLNQVDQVYRDTWQAKVYGYRPRNSAAESRLLTGLAQHGWLRSYLLSDASGPLAFDVAFQYDGVFHAQEIGYAQAAGEHSPGTVLMHLYIEDLYRENTPRLLDFGLGDASYKRSLCNTQIAAAAVYLVPRTRWRWIVRFQRLLYAVERGVRGLLIRLKLDRIVRKWLKRQN